LPLDPSSGHTIHISKQHAGEAPGNRVTHGHGGERRQPDAMHPGKTEKTATEKIYFLPRRFSVFIVPVKIVASFP